MQSEHWRCWPGQVTCANCGQLSTTAGFQCGRNHSICVYCRHRYRICPVCPPENDGLLSLDLMYPEVHVPCTYRSRGCQFALPLRDIGAHERFSCRYRMLLCKSEIPATQECNFSGTLPQLKNHLMNLHGGDLFEQTQENSLRLAINATPWSSWYNIILAYEEVFLFFISTNQRDVSAHAIFVGPIHEAWQYLSRVTLHDVRSGESLDYEGNINCMHVGRGRYEYCLSVPIDTASRFMDESRNLRLNVRVIRQEYARPASVSSGVPLQPSTPTPPRLVPQTRLPTKPLSTLTPSTSAPVASSNHQNTISKPPTLAALRPAATDTAQPSTSTVSTSTAVDKSTKRLCVRPNGNANTIHLSSPEPEVIFPSSDTTTPEGTERVQKLNRSQKMAKK